MLDFSDSLKPMRMKRRLGQLITDELMAVSRLEMQMIQL
jgi:hypothetical protein